MKKERKRYIQKQEKKRIYVWLTMEEFACLAANVKKSGLRQEPYLRALIEGREVREAPTADWRKLIGLLSGIGNNLNQLTRRAHYSGQMDTEKIHKALGEIGEIFDHVKQWWKY